jgi:sugar lactone lactonase YvrE
VFGPDGRLCFTDSGTDLNAAADPKTPGAIYAIAGSGAGEVVVERPNAYPNGIAFDRAGRLHWSESARHAVCRLGPSGVETFCQFDSTHIPDGMAFAQDGRLFVRTTTSGGLSVVSEHGEHIDDIVIGEQATNCAFGGTCLYVTATRTAEIRAEERTGTLWQVDVGIRGAPLFPGSF